jgi:hypothetical protein
MNKVLLRHKLAPFRPADNKRVARAGALGGWDIMRQRLVGREGVPMIYFFSTCKDAIRTIPALQHDPDKPEDVQTESEDHAGDEVRYACMSRPWIKAAPATEPLPRHETHLYVGKDGIVHNAVDIKAWAIKRMRRRQAGCAA